MHKSIISWRIWRIFSTSPAFIAALHAIMCSMFWRKSLGLMFFISLSILVISRIKSSAPSAFISAGRLETLKSASPAGSISTPRREKSSRCFSIISVSCAVTSMYSGISMVCAGMLLCALTNLSYKMRSCAACWSIKYSVSSLWAIIKVLSTCPIGQMLSVSLFVSVKPITLAATSSCFLNSSRTSLMV